MQEDEQVLAQVVGHRVEPRQGKGWQHKLQDLCGWRSRGLDKLQREGFQTQVRPARYPGAPVLIQIKPGGYAAAECGVAKPWSLDSTLRQMWADIPGVLTGSPCCKSQQRGFPTYPVAHTVYTSVNASLSKHWSREWDAINCLALACPGAGKAELGQKLGKCYKAL